MAVLIDDTKRTASQVEGAYNEKQRIQINSVYLEEKQVMILLATIFYPNLIHPAARYFFGKFLQF